MNPLDQYELLESRTSDAERETFEAREISTGRTLFIHFLRSAPARIPLGRSLLELAQIRLRSENQSQGTATVYQVGGRCFIVTPATPEYSNPRPWLERGAPNLEARESTVPTGSDTQHDAEGVTGFSASRPFILVRPEPAKSLSEFEEHFGMTPDAKLPQVPGSSRGSENPGPGEFTRLFRRYSEIPTGPSEKVDEQIQRPNQRSAEYSNRPPESHAYHLRPDSIPPTQPEAPRLESIGRSAHPGDFTRKFVSPQKNKIADVWKKTDIDDSVFSKLQSPAENTKSVDTRDSESSESVSDHKDLHLYGTGESQPFGKDETSWSRKLEVNLRAEYQPDITPPVQPPSQPSSYGGFQQTASGPGEYTRVISTTRNTPPPPIRKTETTVTQSETLPLKQKSPLKLIVILNVLAILALLWVLYFSIVAVRK